MKRYTYLTGPDGRVVGVKDGFCWPAFLFGGLWPLIRREWLLAFAMLAVFAGLVFIDEAFVKGQRSLIRAVLMLAAYIAYMVVCGFKGNVWLRAALERRGYSTGGGASAA